MAPRRILTFNLEHGGQNYNLSRAIKIIRGADIVVLQEITTFKGVNAAAIIAANLSWYIAELPNATAVLSRSPVEVYNLANSIVKVGKGKRAIYVVSLHLDDYPYQPFQANGIDYCYKSCNDDGNCRKTCQPDLNGENKLVKAADNTRGRDISRALRVAKRLAQTAPVVVAGDFNEPSHLDWTKRAAAAGLCPLAVKFPTSRQLWRAGFVDAFRHVNPDEVAEPGHTWPAIKPKYKSRPDRIDFIYVRKGDIVRSVNVVKNSPSDHAPVLARVEFTRRKI